jgi:integrase/recombinase XerD
VRGHASKPQSNSGLAAVIRDTTRLWRKHGLGYDQTKYVVEHVRHELDLAPPTGRRRSVDRLDRFEVERLIQAAYRTHSRHGLMISRRMTL